MCYILFFVLVLTTRFMNDEDELKNDSELRVFVLAVECCNIV